MSFSAVTALVPDGDTGFTATIDPEWSVGGKPLGGYLQAIVARAATSVVPHEHPVATSAHFLRSPDPGPCVLSVEVLREGRSASQVRVGLSQDGQRCVEALVTVAGLDPEAETFWDAGVPVRADGAAADAVRLPSTSPTGLHVALFDAVDIRLDPSCLSFAAGKPTGRGELWGWVTLPDGESFDAVSLVFALDCLPPATLDIEVTGWVPTLELTTYVRGLPAPGPVRVLHRAGLVEGRRVDESCWVWDSRGRLVAHSTQLAGIRLG